MVLNCTLQVNHVCFVKKRSYHQLHFVNVHQRWFESQLLYYWILNPSPRVLPLVLYCWLKRLTHNPFAFEVEVEWIQFCSTHLAHRLFHPSPPRIHTDYEKNQKKLAKWQLRLKQTWVKLNWSGTDFTTLVYWIAVLG